MKINELHGDSKKVIDFWGVLFWVLFLSSIAIRTIIMTKIPTEPVFDFARYYQAAVDLAEGKGFVMFGRPSAFQGVGYPALLAGFFYFLGPSTFLAKGLNLLMSIIGALLFYRLLVDFFPLVVARLATLTYAFMPKELLYVNVLGTEIFFNLMLIAFFYLYLLSWKFNKKKSCYLLIACGVLLGIMSLTKPLAPVYGLIIVIGESLRYLGRETAKNKSMNNGFCWYDRIKQSIIGIALVGITSILVIAPWTYRNYQVFNAYVPISTNGGYVLYLSNNPYSEGKWMDPNTIPDNPLLEIRYPESDPRYELEMNRIMKERAVKYIIDEPISFFRLAIGKMEKTYYNNWDYEWAVYSSKDPLVSKNQEKALSDITNLYHSSLAGCFFILFPFCFAAPGLKLLFLKKTHMSEKGFAAEALLFLMGISAVLMLVIVMVTEANARYTFPSHPVFALFFTWVAYRLSTSFEVESDKL